ncbi:MAG: nuclear transport factor 2 family protein [Steroidobacteraceae bacterium]
MEKSHILLALALAGTPCFAPCLAAAGHKTDDLAWFQRVTQKLRDGIATGDTAVWNRYLTQDFIMTTEDGEVVDKQQLLADIKPLQPGFSGVEKIRDLTVHRWENTAVVHFWMDEREDAYGQILYTTYVETDTFCRQSGSWKMVAAQVTVVPRNFRAVKVDSRIWPELVGKYGLSGRSSWPYYVFLRKDALYGGHDLRSATRLIPLSPLVYYRTGSIHIMVFVRDRDGSINKVLELHKYNEVVLDRISKSTQWRNVQ